MTKGQDLKTEEIIKQLDRHGMKESEALFSHRYAFRAGYDYAPNLIPDDSSVEVICYGFRSDSVKCELVFADFSVKGFADVAKTEANYNYDRSRLAEAALKDALKEMKKPKEKRKDK